MVTMLMIISPLLILSMTVMLIASFLSKKSMMDREKSSPFECGFDPLSATRLPFSLRFFLIAVIFLIFDVEITLLLPMAIIYKNSNMLVWTTISILFILALMGGTYHEWNQGALNWAE
uniref:NADH-ubiquinone oxidoreductase chain 3 n=1 Tax=Nesomachilis australica TaxID=299218 RepID=Q5C847_9INSE|nr:NADH dehydrogenase subunit 3 [Nesomachilis australica]AAV50269.1 NADH dehydrogenase subunit 3 [Nesomachilis australica]